VSFSVILSSKCSFLLSKPWQWLQVYEDDDGVRVLCMARMCQNVYVLSFDSIFEVVAL
jgi:hypothetical protein